MNWKVRHNKYNTKKVILDNGEKFDSLKEYKYYQKLLLCKNAILDSERVIDIKRQVKYPFITKYEANNKSKITNRTCYIADYVVTYADSHIEVIDVKGFRTEEYKRKKKIIEYLYNIKIIEK